MVVVGIGIHYIFLCYARDFLHQIVFHHIEFAQHSTDASCMPAELSAAPAVTQESRKFFSLYSKCILLQYSTLHYTAGVAPRAEPIRTCCLLPRRAMHVFFATHE
jgi:hypothetical protein